jgi:quercetin dioxygenase-like cupin family protein
MAAGERGFAVENVVVHQGDAEQHRIVQVEGRPLAHPAEVRVLAEGAEMIVLEVTMQAGGSSPEHVHDHESVGYLVRGRARTEIDGVAYELAPGDGFRHPPGAAHTMAALEDDTVWLEIKSPPARTW